ncbi:MAG: hypothetical protein K2I75_03525, partial [Clostridiales bacterium]|nr:hypothetical protein [Clostridiales bacterium]
MQKTSLKRNLLLLSVLVIAVLALFVAVFLPNRAAHADKLTEGNNAGSAVQTSAIDVTFNVNGKTQEATERDTTRAFLTQHNGLGQRKRYIYATAVAGGSAGQTFKFVDNSVINSIETHLKISQSSVDDGLFSYLEVEALSKIQVKGSEESNGYFSVVVVNDDDPTDRRTVYLKATINDTFIQYTTLAEDTKTLYVGNKVVDGNEERASFVNGKHQAILRINNFSNITVSLDDYLRDRALYEGASKLKDSDKDWTVRSVTNLEIDSVEFEGLALNLQNEIKSATVSDDPQVRIAPYVTGRVEIDDRLVDAYNRAPGNDGKKFWTEIHTLVLRLKQIGLSESSYSISIPCTFIPNNPQSKTISSSYLRLNVTSTNGFNLHNKSYVRETTESGEEASVTNDYGAIYVRPSDLIEYSAPEGYLPSIFAHSGTMIKGPGDQEHTTELNGPQTGIKVESVKYENGSYVLDEDNPWPEIYKISTNNMVGDAVYNIKFSITWYTGSTSTDGHTFTTNINVTTYGGYTVTFKPIDGKDEMSYNALNDSVFARLRADGYLLTGAKSLNDNQLKVTFVNNVLTLAPKVDNIDGQTTAKVRLEFTNNNREKLTFDSEIIDIDVNAGSFFSRFEDWEAWLIIAACILGGIIIILFIVWVFLHALSKRKQDELAMQAPVSSYIVKLNSTIAATQAQQRAAQNQALSQASTQMLLGAGPATGAAPLPDTLQLATGQPSTPSSPSSPLMSEPQATVPPTDGDENLNELIAKYISDDELLERIFTEKYEPKGMVRRTFFKSKDLQARELDKEKKRIIDRYKTPMPMDEAIMSETEIKNSGATSTPAATSEPMASEPEAVEMFALDFDPDAPLYVEEEKKSDEFTEEKIDIDTSPEESRLRNIERQNDILNKELAELKTRLDKVQTEVDRAKTMEEELREKIAKAESDDAQYAKDIEDLEFKLASAKNKDKPIITRDIGIKEEKKKRNSDELERLRQELETLLGNG